MKSDLIYNPEATADICLLLEGTFPYVRGGVSTWVKQIIEGMPHLTFSIIFLGAHDGDYEKPAYDIPDNVVHIELHYLLGDDDDLVRKKQPFWKRASSKAEQFEKNSELHSMLANSEGPISNDVAIAFSKLLVGPGAISKAELQHSKSAWNTIKEKYDEAPDGLDFNHFFWTIRAMHGPLFTLANIAKDAPVASVYHSVSTGYAGFLGSLLSTQTGSPYIISEHGIYTKERELDLAQVDWIPEELDPFKVGLNDNMNYLRSVWIRFFKSLGRMSYASSNHIYTLYNGNRLRQIADGAPENKLTVVPNGVNVERFKKVRRADDAPVPPVLALIGRVVPIKDIKNFIRAMRVIRAKVPGAEGWLVGPQDEDPDYTRECKLLVESLDLGNCVKFLGFQSPDDIFPRIGLSVLTSVSEGQPLVMLEGYAAGIPAVSTDVGSCSELVYGVGEEDKAIGASGAVVPIANPSEFAEAAIELLNNDANWRSARDAAINRVEAYYDEKDMIQRYQEAYQSQLDLNPAISSSISPPISPSIYKAS